MTESRKKILTIIQHLKLAKKLEPEQIDDLIFDIFNDYNMTKKGDFDKMEYLNDLCFIKGYGDALKNCKTQTEEQLTEFLKKIQEIIEIQEAGITYLNGKEKTIIPPTRPYIEGLIYDYETYDTDKIEIIIDENEVF